MPMSPGLSSLMAAVPAMPRAGAVGAPGTNPTPPPTPAAGAGVGAGPGDDIMSQIANATLGKGMIADPKAGLEQIKQCKMILAGLLPKYANKPGGVDKHISRVFGPLDAAIKAAEESLQYAGPTAPIDFSGANSNPGGAPGPMPIA